MTHASRDTTTGLNFEKQIVIKNDGICLTKNNLYKYLEKKMELIGLLFFLENFYLMKHIIIQQLKSFLFMKRNINKLKVLLTKNHRLVALRFGSIRNLVAQLVRKKQLILIFLALGSHRINIVICFITFVMK